MKTLYISDLDGTLLNQDGIVSDYTIQTLNTLIDQGIYFSVATARTIATTIHLLENVQLKTPIVLQNGVLVYDPLSKTYIKKEILSPLAVKHIITAVKKVNQSGLMYSLVNEELITYYEFIKGKALTAFIDERKTKYHKQFTHTHDFNHVTGDIIYFCFIDKKERIDRLHKEICSIAGIRFEMYADVYSEEDLWYLEIFNEHASKHNAVQFLRKECQFDKIVGFGDNLNDLPLFLACDECYAVGNAKEQVKSHATQIIGANYEDGVANWLKEHSHHL